MDGYKLNKLAGSIILAVLIIMGIKEVNNALNTPENPEQQAYVIEGVVTEAAAGDTAAPVEEAPVETLAMRLAGADAAAGAKAFKKCTQCHTIEPGGRHLQGPNLHNIIGSAIGSKEGYRYSDGVASHGGTWTYEAMEQCLKKPSGFIARTKMVQATKKDATRADLILFLRENSENPPPLPVVDLTPAVEEAAEEMMEEAPAAEGAAEEAIEDAVEDVAPVEG